MVAHWAGSTHDSRIFYESDLYDRFENNEFNGALLGDSGYPLKQYLITPVRAPQGPAERRFNDAHIRTRVKVNPIIKLKLASCVHTQ